VTAGRDSLSEEESPHVVTVVPVGKKCREDREHPSIDPEPSTLLTGSTSCSDADPRTMAITTKRRDV
jgi:hypothetical protein